MVKDIWYYDGQDANDLTDEELEFVVRKKHEGLEHNYLDGSKMSDDVVEGLIQREIETIRQHPNADFTIIVYSNNFLTIYWDN